MSPTATSTKTGATRKVIFKASVKNPYVYFFGEGGKGDKDLLGGKGAGLHEMTRLGIPVPPGFTISTAACRFFLAHPNVWPEALEGEAALALRRLEESTGKGFGSAGNPLLVSVRSGARVSMPGMMDTVLNLGLNDETVEGLARHTGNPRFAWDAYRRFIQMFSNVVLELEMEPFEAALLLAKQTAGVRQDQELSAEALQNLVGVYKHLVLEQKKRPFPQEPSMQLKMAINAVFHSWKCDRATSYRKIHGIPQDMGTAVNVQAMVFGNMGETSGTGVAFTRDPSTGEKVFYGEFLMNAQGEDVVAGIRTPQPIASLQKVMPKAFRELSAIAARLEKHYRDMQDIEFTVESGRLYMLQTRGAKRTAPAAVRAAVEMVREGLIDEKEALKRLDLKLVDQLLHPTLDPQHKQPVIARGLPASPGAASGKAVFESRAAYEAAQAGQKVILVRKETSPDDIDGMHAAQGILTATGGMTSHAAVVARGMNKCCVSGCSDLVVNEKAQKFVTADGREIHAGDVITLNGSTGEVILGEVPTRPAEITEHFKTILAWADKYAKLKVRANGDTPVDAAKAMEFGATGIGLCRTEHMFFELDRIPVVQEMILSKSREERVAALDKLEVMQTGDFCGIFRAMKGLPVTVRLLDPPLHEFLPRKKEDIEMLAERAKMSVEHLRDVIESLDEVNPMLGHRGCRLMVTYPEITVMQTRAILTAACEVMDEGVAVIPEIMVPLVGTPEELKLIKKQIHETAHEVLKKRGRTLTYKVGTMIEVPRACVAAGEIAMDAEFFSFGTNDLTQMTFGFSRDDIGKFVHEYLSTGILSADPFVTIDQTGVGELVKMAVAKGRAVKPDLKIGVCGEHGGDPASILFFHQVGLDYVSCSPYRVPIARIAAAQANL